MSASAKQKVPEPDAVAAPAAAASSRKRARVRRRRRATVKQLGCGYEYMDLDDDLNFEPDASPDGARWTTHAVASDRGAQNSGFAGATRKYGVTQAAGLMTLAGDRFGGSPQVPMLPGGWDTHDAGSPEQFGESEDG